MPKSLEITFTYRSKYQITAPYSQELIKFLDITQLDVRWLIANLHSFAKHCGRVEYTFFRVSKPPSLKVTPFQTLFTRQHS